MTIINDKDTLASLAQEAKDQAAASYITHRDELIKLDHKPVGIALDHKPLGIALDQVAFTTAMKTQVGGSHYKDMKIQPIEYCQKNGLSYCESNAIKYISRHRKKNGREDVLKAIHMLNLLLELEYDK